MNGDDKFWLGVNINAAILIIFIIGLSLDYWKDHNTKIVELIKNGVDPVEAMCAIQDDYGKHPTCLVIAVKENK